MKSLCFIIGILCSVNLMSAQSIEGSWRLISLNDEAVTDREVIKIVTENYFALGSKTLADNSFLGAAGGEYKIKNGKLIEKRDFDTYDASKINEERAYKLSWIDEAKLKISDDNHIKVWQRLSKEEDKLSGNWVITGRKRGDKMNEMTPGDRRTIKILNANRFQWVAFNSATKTFMASGGGKYSAKEGNYVEHITFFSRDENRVGADLNFAFEIIDGKWHHKGQSSKGQPIYEIWSPYAEAYPTAFMRQN
ncbi:hypothetical protein [Psychroflexus sediminis]|uniref:Membrane or secreted protein n=1 Tax=Psychroflexus sediminis TaxID=470826 RepID=A0A1G7XID6_9FLAO|nr:hypothetical protein [Psychroflexus sediminis]SDG83968.1 hypothetical protein SAMN04488027_108136 [Psychroflexus sediminis]